ncbi:hypothetical protein DFH08DRAFT_967850 [Mycena albidolilacea]|uniref:Uncharacterized protein n=1 Tax=Mycena albidolilacea TaxID=1033008 RepID=A0AAD6ZLA4_9AGAR|nr:hypothetical protein DFH08DRAFT_967850 [Mycena albidolilacea]
MDLLKADPRLTRRTPLVKFTGSKIRVYNAPAAVTKTPMILPGDPTFRPMASSPVAVSEIVWDRVLYTVMISDEVSPTRSYTLAGVLSKMDDDRHAMKKNSRRLKFLLVSKNILRNRLALPYLYRDPTFWNNARLQRFEECLCAHASLGVHVHEIRRYGDPPFCGSETRRPDFVRIFSCTSRLVRLISDSGDLTVMRDAFEGLANTAGVTLTEISGFRVKPNDFRMSSDPTPFMHFTVLRSLKWNSLITFSKGTPGQSSAALSALESLDEASTIFEHCPALLHFELRLVGAYGDDGNYPPGLACPPKHHSLVKVVVQKSPAAGRNARDDHAEWTKFWANSAWGDFPALRRTEVVPLEWPPNECVDILLSPLVPALMNGRRSC